MSFSESNSINQGFNDHQARVLGTLCEKQLAGSKSYPLTINDTRIACCQKSGRDPMMTMTNHDVRMAARQLAAHNLITIDHSGRTERYAHCVNTTLGIDTPTLALLTVQLLRGALSVAQLRSSSQRFHPFADNLEVEQTLSASDLFRIAPREPAQRGHRYTHALETRLAPADAVEQPLPGSSRAPSLNGVRNDLNQLRSLLRPVAPQSRVNTNQ